MNWPSVADIANELRDIRAECLETKDDPPLEVRLQVYPPSGFITPRWAIRVGCASYDLDHSGYWGAGELDYSVRTVDVARDLLEQAQEQFSQDPYGQNEEGAA